MFICGSILQGTEERIIVTWSFSKLFLIQTYLLLFAIKGAVAMVRLHQLYVTLSKRFLCWNPSTLYSAHLDPGNRTLLHRCQHVMAFLSADEYKKKCWNCDCTKRGTSSLVLTYHFIAIIVHSVLLLNFPRAHSKLVLAELNWFAGR